jgi:thiamine-phosphate pyrophosphorylase
MPARLPQAPFLYPILDPDLLGPRSVGFVVETLRGLGAELFQLRVKRGADASFLALAREAVAATRGVGGILVVNDRPDVALLAGAHGVHVGQTDLPPSGVRRLLGEGLLVGVSTHNREQVAAAAGLPVDYVAVGPVFETRTKAEPDPVVGPALVAEARRLVGCPVIAIGGIGLQNIREVVASGAAGIALASAIFGAPDMSAAFRALRDSL